MAMVGMDSLVDQMSTSLSTGPRDLGFTRLIKGQRGSGKTALLAEISEQASAHGFVVIDVDASSGGLLGRIISSAASAMGHLCGSETEVRRAEASRQPPVGIGQASIEWDKRHEQRPDAALRGCLVGLIDKASQHEMSVLLAVDNLHAGSREELRRLAADIQAITKVNEMPLALIGAGLPEIDYTILADDKVAFFRRCHQDQLPLLSYSDAWSCLHATTESAGGEMDDAALKHLSAQSDNSTPYRVQSLGHHAWNLAGAPEHPIGERAAIAATELSGEDMAQNIVAPIWNDMGAAEQEYLSCLARLGGTAKLSDVAQHLPGIPSATLARIVDQLHTDGHVAWSSAEGTLAMTGSLTAAQVLEKSEMGAPPSGDVCLLSRSP